MDRTIHQTFQVGGVLTDVTTAKLSDPTGTYGIKRNDTDAVVVADGTSMTKTATGTYEYVFDATAAIAYTAYIEFVYDGDTFYIEFDVPAVADYGLLASYYSLLERVGHYLFGIRSGFSADQTNDIKDCIKDGLHDVHTAHSWSFFRPLKKITTTAPYSTGTVEIVDGVVTLTTGTFPSWAAVGSLYVDGEYYDVDSRDGDTQVTLEDTSVDVDAGTTYVLYRLEYDLPTGFESIETRLTYEPGKSDFYPPVEMRDDRFIREKQQDDPYTDRPVYFSVRTVEFDPTVGSLRRLSFYPLADAAYIMYARMKLRPTMIDETNLYPIGAETLSQLMLEACLAAAERNFEEQLGTHTKRFMELLPLAIRADLEMTSPTTLGRDNPRDESSSWDSRRIVMGDITLNGTTM